MRHIFTNLYIMMLAVAMPSFAEGHPVCRQGANDGSPVEKTVTSSSSSARRTRSGIIVLGSGKNVRAFEPYGGRRDNGEKYANAVNKYKQVLGNGVNVYCMIIPTAVEYYCPDSIRSWTHDEKQAMDGIFSHLSDSVIKVDIYDVRMHIRRRTYIRVLIIIGHRSVHIMLPDASPVKQDCRFATCLRMTVSR